MFCRSDSWLCWPCWHGKWWRNRENLSTTWFDTPTGQRGKWYEKYSLRLILTFYLNWQPRNRLLKLLDCAGDFGRAIQNDVDINTYYCKPELISWWWINKTVSYTHFLSPADHKCAESSTYWQFFYYRPPGKFRWTSVNHFDKHREISLKCDAKNISLSLYIYVYRTLDNRFLKILVVIGHVCIYWSKVAEGFSAFKAVLLCLGIPIIMIKYGTVWSL